MSKSTRKRARAPTKQVASQQVPASGKGGSRRLIPLLGLGIVLVAIALYIRHRAESDPALRIPPVETRDVLPTVAKEIRQRQEAIMADPDSAEAWGMYGLVLLAHDFRDQAATCFTEAEKLDGRDYRWPYYYGMTLGTIDAERSLHAFERAVEVEPNRITLRLRLAEWQFDMRRLEECEREVTIALEQEPGNARAQLLMARLRLQQGRVEESLQYAEQAAASRYRNRRDVHELLARLYTRLGRPNDAQREVELAEKLPRGVAVWNDPEMGFGGTLMRDASILNTQATLHRWRGDVDMWLQTLQQVVQAEPDNIRAKERLAQALLDAKKYTEANQFIETVLRDYPNFSEFECLRGQIDMAQGHATDAQRHFERAIELKHDFGQAFMWLGRALLDQGKYKQAIDALSESVRLSPSLAEAHHALGLAYQHEGQLDEAIHALKDATNLKPGDLDIALHLAAALSQADQRGAAIQILQTVIRTAEDPSEAEELLKKLNDSSEAVKPGGGW